MKKAVLGTIVLALAAAVMHGCSAGSDVSTDDVKSKEAQINDATSKLPQSSTHPAGDERER